MSETIHFSTRPGRKQATKGDSDLRGLSVIFTLDETAILKRKETDDEAYLFRYQTDRAGMSSPSTLVASHRPHWPARSRSSGNCWSMPTRPNWTPETMPPSAGLYQASANCPFKSPTRTLQSAKPWPKAITSMQREMAMPKPTNDCPRCGAPNWSGYCGNCGYDQKHRQLPPDDSSQKSPKER